MDVPDMSQLLDRLETSGRDSTDSASRSGRSRTSRRVAGRAPILPGSRAILGALLCTLAALITFTAYSRAIRPPTTRYLVATRDIEPGATLRAADVQAVPIALPDAVAQRVVGPSVSLEDAVVLGPVAKGELFQVGNLIKKAGGSGSRELSFPIDSAFAAAGRIRPGDRIDVYAGKDDRAESVATNLLVIATSNPPDSVNAGRGTIVLTVSYDGTFDGAGLLGAAQNTKLSLIRRTGVTGDIRATTPPKRAA
jgi:Flp pilus assembly protein CpaB